MMSNSIKQLLCLCLLVSPFIVYTSAICEETTDVSSYQKKLDRLQKSILKIQEHLKDTRGRRGHILTELKQLESNISKNARSLKANEIKIEELNDNISQLNSDIDTLNQQLNKQRAVLADQIRAAYALGSQQSLRMLLNQQNPAEMGRVNVYFDYLNRAREKEILNFLDAIQTKQKKEAELASARSAYEKATQKRKKQEKELKKQRLNRNQLLGQLDTRIKNQEQTLSDLETSRSKIEDLLMSLGQLLADIPPSPGDELPFNQQKGRLPWPIQGPFLAKYGQPKEQGDLKWNGVLIGTPYGSPVRSVSHGRVAFSDWLQGFGFITIVDHGDGYMSLYGHNESLFKQAGDWVGAGEVIATAGDSGGQPNPGLYFEIRSRGKPVDPFLWCSSSAQHTASQ